MNQLIERELEKEGVEEDTPEEIRDRWVKKGGGWYPIEDEDTTKEHKAYSTMMVEMEERIEKLEDSVEDLINRINQLLI